MKDEEEARGQRLDASKKTRAIMDAFLLASSL